jgi:predicted ArsR family transcriptional regulator
MSKTTRKKITTKTKRAASKPAPAVAKAPRAASKQARLVEMLRQPEGATIDEIVKALDWQAHTVRGAMSGALKKKLGLTIESEKVDDRGRVYRIAE